jgi:hypothetical protein
MMIRRYLLIALVLFLLFGGAAEACLFGRGYTHRCGGYYPSPTPIYYAPCPAGWWYAPMTSSCSEAPVSAYVYCPPVPIQGPGAEMTPQITLDENGVPVMGQNPQLPPIETKPE